MRQILVDSMHLAYRAHFAFSGLQYNGQPTGVYHGFIKQVNDLREKVSGNLVFCWDYGVPGRKYSYSIPCWRTQLWPQYKSQRRAAKENDTEWQQMRSQLPRLVWALSCLGYANIGAPGLEADDIISILSRQLGGETFIYSNDCDLYQILTVPNVRILWPTKEDGHYTYLTRDSVEQNLHVPLDKWAYYLAMGGDKSDNIKPVRGLGPKTAAKLVIEGADPRLPFNQQPYAIQHFKLLNEDIWHNVQKAYSVAALPEHWNDSRIPQYKPLTVNPRAQWNSPQQRDDCRSAFERFCANYALMELLSLRHRLFHLNGDVS